MRLYPLRYAFLRTIAIHISDYNLEVPIGKKIYFDKTHASPR